ncbi:hypothetical protein CORC01_08665 [Colletotrichum orchidophilum]|uniref:Uncharacterized protein n=1 Tax=Colletotrichum orchidophilum TaxID=1209926 RepID=A0A1G4B3V7_9PEZI|nr:uncharacterized protein CORC01_08665 [Colletotrichum orchidophilum]OHE95972.1 hypothetical protein CORC01_08665 [Colletotrichum orchidophilum]
MDDTNIRSWASRLKSYIPTFGKREKMANEDKFVVTDTIVDRYANKRVLQKTLLAFKFPKGAIKMRATAGNGFELQLPRKLTAEEVEEIRAAFKKASEENSED